MKKQALLAGIAASALALTSAAFAADLSMPVKAPPMAPPAFSWSGCYVGGHVGWGWSRNQAQDAPGGPTSSNIDFAHLFRTATTDASGGLYGGQLGCDYQFQGPWVVGIQGSVAGANIAGSAADPFGPGASLQPKTDFLADVTGRIGYAWNGMLLYAKGGGAWADERFTETFTGGGSGVSQAHLSGGVAGAGLEWSFAPNWSALVEYDHYFMGSKIVPLNLPGAFTLIKLGEDINIVKVGLNYRFSLWPTSAHR